MSRTTWRLTSLPFSSTWSLHSGTLKESCSIFFKSAGAFSNGTSSVLPSCDNRMKSRRRGELLAQFAHLSADAFESGLVAGMRQGGADPLGDLPHLQFAHAAG